MQGDHILIEEIVELTEQLGHIKTGEKIMLESCDDIHWHRAEGIINFLTARSHAGIF